MTPDILLALVGFTLVTSMTPGPNTLMLLASGANFGLRRSVPHILGIVIGFPAMVGTVGLGIYGAFDRWPLLHDVLLWASVIYMLWLAWKVAHAAPPPEVSDGQTGRPLSFLQAAGFQWVNPKAWSMALASIALYAASREPVAILWVVGAFAASGVVTTTAWTVLGQTLRRLLSTPHRLRAFNWSMAALLIASLLPVVLS